MRSLCNPLILFALKQRRRAERARAVAIEQCTWVSRALAGGATLEYVNDAADIASECMKDAAELDDEVGMN